MPRKGGIVTGFRLGAYAKCWTIEPGKGNFTKCRMSISRKNKDTGEYDQEFSGYVMMIGQAHAKAQRLREGDRIKLGDVDVTTTYNKAQNREYINYKCFDFEMADDAPQQSAPHRAVESNPVDGEEEEDLPF